MSLAQIDPLAWGYVGAEWTIRLAMLVVVPFRRSPDAARGWLLIVFFLPLPALVLYLLIGRPSYPRWRRRRFAAAGKLLAAATNDILQSRHCCRPELSENLTPAARLIERLGQFPALSGNHVELLPDYARTVDRLIRDIDEASDHVHILVYIFADDRTGLRVIDALVRAARRGVSCRVLIDAVGSRPWARRVRRRLAPAGVEIERALPVSLFRRRSARADLRNHRKIVVIDGRIGFIGSQNIIAADAAPTMVNRELVVRATGPVVVELQAVFIADWFLETGRVLDAPRLFPRGDTAGDTVAQLLPSGPDYPIAGAERLVVALVHGAHDRVVITTPYFIPDEPLLQALQTAVLRGTEVVLIVSHAADHWLVSLAQHSYYDELLRAGVAVHLFREGLLHAKHISVDDAVSVVGSTNIDIRSFLLNAEASLIVYDRNVTRELRAEQQRTLAASDRLLSSEWSKRSWSRKLIENMARLVSPLL